LVVNVKGDINLDLKESRLDKIARPELRRPHNDLSVSRNLVAIAESELSVDQHPFGSQVFVRPRERWDEARHLEIGGISKGLIGYL
jgi:hypothetical protein